MGQTFLQMGTCPAEGQEVQVVRLRSTKGMLIKEHYLTVRRLGKGVAKSFAPGHGGEVWFVDHGDGNVGAYSTDEMGPLAPQQETVP